jgi:hypothetical protein
MSAPVVEVHIFVDHESAGDPVIRLTTMIALHERTNAYQPMIPGEVSFTGQVWRRNSLAHLPLRRLMSTERGLPGNDSVRSRCRTSPVERKESIGYR